MKKERLLELVKKLPDGCNVRIANRDGDIWHFSPLIITITFKEFMKTMIDTGHTISEDLWENPEADDYIII